MIEETARANLVPESLAGMVALGVLSTAAGGGVNIRSRGDSTLNANLFILAIAKSGTGKGCTYSAIAKPLTETNHAQLEEWRNHLAPDIQAAIEITEEKLKAEKMECVKNGKSPDYYRTLHAELAQLKDDLSREPRLIAGETTEQKLGMLLSGQPHEAIGNHSSEARGLIQIIMGKFSGNSGATGETMYLAGYSGDPYSIERAGRPDISLKNPCISALLMVQPDVIQKLTISDAMTTSGFLPRFLMADVKADLEDEPEHAVSVQRETAEVWEELVDAVLDAYRQAREKITIEVDAAAHNILREALNRIRKEGREGGPLADLTSYVARYGENLRKIALLLHIARHADQSHKFRVSEDTAHDACMLSDWFLQESLSILRASQREKWQRLHERLVQIIQKADGQRETLRNLRDRHTITDQEITTITGMFPDSFRLTEVRNPKGGRPSMQLHLAG